MASTSDTTTNKVLESVPPFDVTSSDIEDQCAVYVNEALSLSPVQIRQYMIKAVLLMDLTSLNSDDTTARIDMLCRRAHEPLDQDQVTAANVTANLRCAAVCTYPIHTAFAASRLKEVLNDSRVQLAAVAGGFPSGQYRLESRVLEVRLAMADGATEIDIVINRSAAAEGDWQKVFREIETLKNELGDDGQAKLKTILATGELKSLEVVHTASWVAMIAGSDFIKTSTGKEAINATMTASLVMIRAIRDFHEATGRKVGFKAAGGIKSVSDVLPYLLMVERELGPDWLNPATCRIGASSLLDDVVKKMANTVYTSL